MQQDTIAAISTPPGVGGVAIIRLSGASALNIAAKMFAPTGKTPVKDFSPNYMYTGKILCDGFSDFGFCVYFKAPRSFTGEDVVEFHCHGGVQISRGVLKAALSFGAVGAQKGEFTRRAFVNGKLSLSSAEGMIDMINAESLAEVRAGGLLYAEKLTWEVKEIQSSLLNVLAQIAADTDYPEEGIEETSLPEITASLTKAESQLSAMVGAYSVGKLIKSGVSVALCGAPNAGKSSLLNALLGYDRAIVSATAGTTRDIVEGELSIDGVRIILTDTAGIREGLDEVEKIGISRAQRAISSSDIVVCLSDKADFSAADGVEAARLIRAFSKTDKVSPFGSYDIAISAKSGAGLQELKKMLLKMAAGGKSLDGAYIIEERHFGALQRAHALAQSAIGQIGKFPLDVISMDIRECWRTLGEITGETADEEIINTVFAKFCVGK